MANSRCVKTEFDKVILCVGTMKHWIQIQERTKKTTRPGADGIPVDSGEFSFSTVVDYAGRLEALKFTPRWGGVNVDDQSSLGFTHVIYIPFDQNVFEMDFNRFFILFSGTRDRYFKMKSIQDYGEQEQWIAIKVSETGFTDIEGAAV